MISKSEVRMAHGENLTVYLQDIKWKDPSISILVEPEYTALDIVKILVNKTRQFNHNNYELAEIFVSSGQLCKERRLDMSEIPHKVQGLWPKGGALAPDATYRFYLVRKGGPGGFLRSLSWTDCSHSVDVPLDSYLIKFLEQKTAGENSADLCSLPDLNETTLLDNLKRRFYNDTIYTYVGTILIVINPFKFFPIYNPKYVAMYQDSTHRLGELPPHIFAIANAAFTSMLDTQSDQCIVISGESGSGKTENTNFLLHHLTQSKQAQQQQQQQTHHGYGVEQTLLGAGPVLEAFGNAKTVHNDNSSRFGKFIQVDFRKNGSVHGASVEKYLLEKSRIVSQATNERNYHVFYYLLCGASEELTRELFLLKTEEYQYLNQRGCYSNPGVDEVHEFERLKRSMDMVGFKPELQKKIFAVISAILLLGNVEFVKKHTYHHDDAVQVKNIELVSKICKLLDVKEEAFLEALTSKRTVAGGETMVVRYKLEDAISARNAMAKCLYGAIFDWMVWQINHALFQKQDHKDIKSNSIGVLDIFGFEDFQKNSFEQFCINYANEHLQYYFNQHIFKFEQEEYRREQIDWQNISFIDNRRCLDLFSKRPSGLFFLLDEEGNFPGATNETLLEKFHQNHKSSDFYDMPMRRESTFTIRHYAGKVKYHIREFREKNSDLIHADLVSVLKNSNTGFVRELVGNKIGNIRRKTSVTQKNHPREHTMNFPWSDNSETEGGDHEVDNSGSFIHNAAKKNKRKSSARRRQKMYKDYKQFKTYKEVKNRETSKTKTPSVSLQFQKSLQSLLETLDRSHPYFVRCIKSNMDKTASMFDEALVRRQLQYTGMLATVKLRQSGYNYRVLFEDFVKNYSALLPNGIKSSREDVTRFLTSMDGNNAYHSFQVGQTKIFLRETVKMLLDDALHHTLMRHILRIQSWVKGALARIRYIAMRDAAIAIQKVYRGTLTRRIVEPQILAQREGERKKREEEQRLEMRRQEEAEERRRQEEAEERRRQEEAEERRRQEAEERRRQEAEEVRRIQEAEEERRRLKIEEEKQRLEAAEEKRRSIEIEELERKRKIEAEEVERRQKYQEEEDSRRKEMLEEVEQKAACTIQKWYRKNKAILDAKVQQRADTLSKEMENSLHLPSLDPIPNTDIDQLARSISYEENSQSEGLRPTPDPKVESWLDTKSPLSNGVEGHGSGVSNSSLMSDRTSEKQKQEERDEVKSIELVPTTGDTVKRRTSITRKSAFRRRSTKDDDITIPVVQKKPVLSPSISTSDSSELRFPTLGPEDIISSSPRISPEKANSLSKSSESSVDEPLTAGPGHLVIKDHLRTGSDKSELISKAAAVRPDTVSIRPKELRSESIFYTPESRPSDSRHSQTLKTSSADIESPSNPNALQSPVIPEIVVNPKPIMEYLPSPSADNQPATRKDSNKSSASNKSPVRRTSSNDPGILRRANSKSDRVSSLLSPDDALISPSGNPVTRQSSGTSSVEYDDENAIRFMRTHILRKNVQVRKSHSADNLAPPEMTAEHDINMKHGHKSNGPHASAIKSQSYDHLSNKENFEINKFGSTGLVSSKTKKEPTSMESDDSDLGGSFNSVPLPPLDEKRKDFSLPGRSGSKKSSSNKHQSAGSSQWTVSSTSEWNYPEELAIAEMDELLEVTRFIYDKYLDFRGKNPESTEVKSVYDRVFRDAMKEMHNQLMMKSSLSMGNHNNFHPLKYRDLMSNFKDYVTSHVAKNVTEEQAKDFPTPIAINAFRGYLDEFQKKRPHLKRKAPKTKPHKEHKKKPAKEFVKLQGHYMFATQFTMPTFCEVCNKMMFWNIRVPGLECENCKFSCHKKCSIQITMPCQHQPPAELPPNAVFGVSLQLLAGEDNTVPPVLEKLIAELDNRGIYTDGIYRKSGIAGKVRALKKALDNDWEAVNLSEYAVHVLSLTLKNFFRELPQPLFTCELYDEFIRCPDIPDKEEAVRTMRDTVDKLPAINLTVITRLMLHLARIAQNEPYNRMSPTALSIVFAPGLIRTNRHMTAQQSLAQVDKQCRTIELMLSATLKKLNMTLNDINQLESEEQSLEDRLVNVRQSMRRHGPAATAVKRPAHTSRPSSMHPHPELELADSDASSVSDLASPATETPSTPSDSPVDMEMAQQEVKAISEKIKNLQEKKVKLKMTIPSLALTSSDGDDIQSADDIESSAESLDDIEYS